MAKRTAPITKAIARAADTARSKSRKVTREVDQVGGPSPNPKTNLVLADIALRGGGQLLRHAVERTLLGAKYSPDKARNIIKGRSMTQTLIGTALARIATRSVPGAIIIGGGMLAKTLYDRQKDKQTVKKEGAKEVDEQANAGAKS